MNLFQKMATISEAIGVIAKDLSVEPKSGKSYSAVSERAILDAVKPLEAKYGVFSYPGKRTVSSRVENRAYYQNGERRTFPVYIIDLEVEYHFVDVDDPEQQITVSSYGTGMDTGDKAPGKAMTYADKYALMKAYKISTGDDPDANASPADPCLMVGDTAVIPSAINPMMWTPQPEPDKPSVKKASRKKEAEVSGAECTEPASEELPADEIPSVVPFTVLPKMTKDEARAVMVNVGQWRDNPVTMGEIYAMGDAMKTRMNFLAKNFNGDPRIKAAAMTLLDMPY